MRCAICKLQIDDPWAWQPFGPDDNPISFQFPGDHYRGFPVIKVCHKCHNDIYAGERVRFTYRGIVFEFKRPMTKPEGFRG